MHGKKYRKDNYMNIHRYESEVHKDADKAHEAAQRSGYSSDYIKAAELYEKCGDYYMAQVCRIAAERLQP